MRWLWFVLSVVSFAVAFRTHSMGLAAVMLLAALAFLLMFTLALASSRIEARGRDASAMLGPEELARIRALEQRKREAAAAAAAGVVVAPMFVDGGDPDLADNDSVSEGDAAPDGGDGDGGGGGGDSD